MAHPIQQLFEDLKTMPVRLKRVQKDQFLDYAEQQLQAWGFETQRHTAKGKILTNVNLSTKVENPKFVILAHYDTPTIAPPWFEPLIRIFGHTRQLLLWLAIFSFFVLLSFLPSGISNWIWVILMLSFLTFLIPNPYNYNDNTSGVLGLLYLAKQMGGQQSKVKFVLTDNEELGLIGAAQLKRQWRADRFDFNRLHIISLDCIGWGDQPVIVRNGASGLGNDLIDIFKAEDETSELFNLGIIPVNDNYVFRDSGSVVITMMNKTRWKGGYYIKNIHSPFDRKLDLNKIAFVADRVLDYIEKKAEEMES